ncbi:hypothetical protein [Kingella potus]|uniref:hypothetical protein n=1 Tax=Kingella potus TaxID=265175 RepID=UPI001FD3E361|nr:hypothetical protein [Kingella potus]UOP00744.1 hypothetical protein LVJ84_13360 [Kingella potus]
MFGTSRMRGLPVGKPVFRRPHAAASGILFLPREDVGGVTAGVRPAAADGSGR